jgi:hypothetical protein
MRAIATADAASQYRRRRPRQPPPRHARPRAAADIPVTVAAVGSRRRTRRADLRRLGMLALEHDGRCSIPPPDSNAHRLVARDAHLIAGRLLPVGLDGRKQMALRNHRQLDPAPRRPQPSVERQQLAELAHRTGEPLRQLQRLSAGYRAEWLAQLRREDGARARAAITELREALGRAGRGDVL